MRRGIANQEADSAGGDTATGPGDNKQLVSLMTKVHEPVLGGKSRQDSKQAAAYGEFHSRMERALGQQCT